MTKEICTCDRCGRNIKRYCGFDQTRFTTLHLFDASARTSVDYIEKEREVIEQKWSKKELESCSEPILVTYETILRAKDKKYDLCKHCRKELEAFLKDKK